MVTPSTVPQTDLQDKLDEFAATYDSINDLEETVANDEFSMENWLILHDFDPNLVDANNYSRMIKVTTGCAACGSEIADTAQTDALLKEFADIVQTVVNSKIALQKARNHLTDIKSYVSFLKEVGQLAPSQKGGGGNQQKPQQDQGQQA